MDRSTVTVNISPRLKHTKISVVPGTCMKRATFRDGQSRAPLITQDIQTYAAVGVDVGVVDAGCEVDFRRFERVVGRKVNS